MTQKTLIPPEFKLTQSSNFSVTLRKGAGEGHASDWAEHVNSLEW